MTPAELLLTFQTNPADLARVAGVPVEMAERHLLILRVYGWDALLAEARAQVALKAAQQPHHDLEMTLWAG